jgi:putative chitinase
MTNEVMKKLLVDAMDRMGMTDNELRAGTAAIIGGESGFQVVPEASYSGTSNTRIRGIFGAVRNLSDADLSALKADERNFFNFVYGPDTPAGRQVGNTKPEDGFNFRGRGLIQLTGRGNYRHYGGLIGRPDLMEHPELANEPDVAVAIVVVYMKDRYKGGGFEAMKRAVGNPVASTEQRKNELFAKYLAEGTFQFSGAAPNSIPAIRKGDSGPQVSEAQTWLVARGYFVGPRGVDGDFGNATEKAIMAFQRDHGLPVSGILDNATEDQLRV